MTAKPPKKVTMKMLAKTVDQLYEVKQQRLRDQKAVDKLQTLETELTNFLIDNLPVSDASGVAGLTARAQILPCSTPQVKDWDEFYRYLAKKKTFGLLQKRLSAAAIEELWEDGKVVPGVGTFNYKKVSLTKI